MGHVIEILFIIAIILCIAMNIIMRLARKVFIEEMNETKLSGFEIAKQISSKVASEAPHIIKKKGNMLDEYDSNRNVIKLSPEVFDGETIYAAAVAVNVALESDKTKENNLINEHFIKIMIIASYLLIIVGAFMSNATIIHFGMALFCFTFLAELFRILKGKNSKEDSEKFAEYVKEQKVIKPFDEYKDFVIVYNFLYIARLPYCFFGYFR